MLRRVLYYDRTIKKQDNNCYRLSADCLMILGGLHQLVNEILC